MCYAISQAKDALKRPIPTAKRSNVELMLELMGSKPFYSKGLAEREGFEPSIQVLARITV